MLYGVEINEPYQVNAEYKYRCHLQVGDGGEMSWTDKPEKIYATEDEATAQAIADTLAESWAAAVVPLEEGKECPLGDKALIKVFVERAKERSKQRREIR